VQDGSSISKGVAVLSLVLNDDITLSFSSAGESRLCDRSAVEMSSSIGTIDDVGSSQGIVTVAINLRQKPRTSSQGNAQARMSALASEKEPGSESLVENDLSIYNSSLCSIYISIFVG
jgi:hypothetical protein